MDDQQKLKQKWQPTVQMQDDLKLTQNQTDLYIIHPTRKSTWHEKQDKILTMLPQYGLISVLYV